MRSALAILVVVSIAACTSAENPTASTFRPNDIATTTLTTLTPPTGSVTTTPAFAADGRPAHERACGTRIGEAYGPEGSETPALHIGPIALSPYDPDYLEALPAYFYQPDAAGRYEAIKFVLVVDGSTAGPVSVSVDEATSRTVRLVYNERVWAPTWDEADHSVRFEVCPGIDAQFNGGFVVNAPTCAVVLVRDEDRDDKVWHAAIPFGVPGEPCVRPD